MKNVKKDLRARIRRRLKFQSPKSRREKSALIAAKLFAEELFRRAERVAFFVSLPEEVDTRRMIDLALRLGKRVAVPKTDLKKSRLDFYEISSRRELTKGVLGIPEPEGNASRRQRGSTLDCVVVPGLAFDKNFNRLGRGGGFYDRFLKKVGKKTVKIGLGYSFQLVAKVPAEAHDTRLDLVITD